MPQNNILPNCVYYAKAIGEVEEKWRKKMNEIKPFSLKPCPFCGSEVALTTTPLWHDGHGYQGCFEYSVSCKNCGCRVGGSTCDSVYFSEQEAIEKVVKAWNRRKENGKKN